MADPKSEAKKPLSLEERLMALRLQKEELELEQLTHDVMVLRQNRENRKRNAEQNERDLRELREMDAARVEQCNHRSGGEGLEALMSGQGSDANYAVIKHTYPWGETRVHCTRCPAEWKPGDKADEHPSGISYKQALMLPTWNKPSGTQLFLIPRKPKGPGRAA